MTAALRAAALACCVAPALHAQELEPRAYSNLPVDLNFLAAGLLHSRGGLSTDPSLPVEDAHLKIDTGVLAYVRGLSLWGQSGKFDVIVPYSHLAGTALVAGQPAQRNVSGLGDPRFRVSVNFLGAPALSLAEYRSYKPDLVAGASLQVSAPFSQYDDTKVVNLGTHRWSVKPDIGFSKSLYPFTVDLTAGVTFFTDNDRYFGGRRLEQAPLYSTQANVSYDFSGGVWASFGATWYGGGGTTVDGAEKDNELNNSRYGFTLAMPVDRYYSVKFNVSSGISTRTGTNFDTVGLVLQYRWGAGL